MKIRVTAGPRKGRILDWPERQALALVKAKRAERVEKGDEQDAPPPPAGGIFQAPPEGVPIELHGREVVPPPATAIEPPAPEPAPAIAPTPPPPPPAAKPAAPRKPAKAAKLAAPRKPAKAAKKKGRRA